MGPVGPRSLNSAFAALPPDAVQTGAAKLVAHLLRTAGQPTLSCTVQAVLLLASVNHHKLAPSQRPNTPKMLCKPLPLDAVQSPTANGPRAHGRTCGEERLAAQVA